MHIIKNQPVSEALTADKLSKACGGSITFCACIHKIKKMSGFAFVILRTGKYILQSVYSEDKCGGNISDISEGCYVKITGDVNEEKRAPLGYEITLADFTVLSRPAEDYPLHVSARELGCTIETKLEYRSTALRNPKERAVFKISEGVCEGFRRFLLKNDFTEIHTPKIVSAGAEGGANMFRLKYFGKDALLAQSPQFYKQTCVAFFDRVFEIAPVYRAEKHNSTRHLNEYIGLDLEMGYIESMRDVMITETELIRYICRYLKENYSYELEMFANPLPDVGNIPVLTFFEALDILEKPHNQADLDPQDEVRLCEYVKKEYDSEFVFVEKFPAAKRPVYAKNSPEDPKLAESFDLLFRGLEITTGGQRIHDYHEQVEKMKAFGTDPEELSVYLQIHKYGMPPHGGLGIGLERLVMKLLNLANIRQASMFPRDINHLDP
ncbi:MAG: aspartate--tRNA(Asn) ligase [Oscillospiraceae bacterium]|nr:aspartate--tRNA(Asn) ligase [Oscillospiraceae bacterium]